MKKLVFAVLLGLLFSTTASARGCCIDVDQQEFVDQRGELVQLYADPSHPAVEQIKDAIKASGYNEVLNGKYPSVFTGTGASCRISIDRPVSDINVRCTGWLGHDTNDGLQQSEPHPFSDKDYSKVLPMVEKLRNAYQEAHTKKYPPENK